MNKFPKCPNCDSPHTFKRKGFHFDHEYRCNCGYVWEPDAENNEGDKMSDFKSRIDHIEIENNSFLIVKVGSDDRPAAQEDIDLIEKVFKKALDDNFPRLPVIVTHHNIVVELHTCM